MFQNLTSSTRPYISAIGPGFTTISGPPSILESLKACDAFSGKRLYPAPIYGPYHSSSAYTEASLEHALASILEDVEFLENKENWTTLTSWTEHTGFNADLALLSSSVREMKAELKEPGIVAEDSLALRSALRILSYALLGDEEMHELCNRGYLSHASAVLTHHLQRTNVDKWSKWRLAPSEQLVVSVGPTLTAFASDMGIFPRDA